jgi:hypothetical protein
MVTGPAAQPALFCDGRVLSHKGSCRRTAILFLLPLLLIAVQDAAFGWIYPEHRSIMVRAIQKLEPGRRRVLASMWADARKGHESRLSENAADTGMGHSPQSLDYAAWPAIAGDHSCSSSIMLETVLNADWILKVAAVSAELEQVLSASTSRPARTNAVRNADLRLLRTDPEYATRAGANSVHFLLARPQPETDLDAYIKQCLEPGVELNALGAFAWYHSTALMKARLYAGLADSDSAKQQVALAALADEAFAIHFLEDIFAAGHIAGTRGDASLRKGTHDYYNEAGLEARTWDGHSMIVHGDAWMTSTDAERTSEAVLLSLNQLIHAALGEGDPAAGQARAGTDLLPENSNTCSLTTLPVDHRVQAALPGLREIALTTPLPGLSRGEGELPRFRAEVGPFIGFVPAARGALLSGGFGQLQTARGATGGLELALRFGLGLDGVLNESGDGLIFLDVGFRLDAVSTQHIIEAEDVRAFGSIFAATPSRGAFTTRIRTPFWAVPFDLLLAAPFLQIWSPSSFTRMASVAANGGLLPWQSGIATSIGRFQFVLGREVGLSFYGYLKGADKFLIPYGDPNNPSGIVADVRSFGLEFPVVEYMPFRTFSTDQSTSLVVQFYTACDIPAKVTDVYPAGGPAPSLQTVWQFGVRAAFRWRHYF